MNENKPEVYRKNVRNYEAGQLSELVCPRCSTATVSVRFDALPDGASNRSTVYFVCSRYGKYDTAQYEGEPPHYGSHLALDE